MIKIDFIKKCPACENCDIKIHSLAKDPDNLFSTPFTLLRCQLCNLVFLREGIKTEAETDKFLSQESASMLRVCWKRKCFFVFIVIEPI